MTLPLIPSRPAFRLKSKVPSIEKLRGLKSEPRTKKHPRWTHPFFFAETARSPTPESLFTVSLLEVAVDETLRDR
jgi:hypothetical protein